MIRSVVHVYIYVSCTYKNPRVTRLYHDYTIFAVKFLKKTNFDSQNKVISHPISCETTPPFHHCCRADCRCDEHLRSDKPWRIYCSRIMDHWMVLIVPKSPGHLQVYLNNLSMLVFHDCNDLFLVQLENCMTF